MDWTSIWMTLSSPLSISPFPISPYGCPVHMDDIVQSIIHQSISVHYPSVHMDVIVQSIIHQSIWMSSPYG